MDRPPSTFRPESLLAHREWVERTARALVYGDAEAEDLQQQAWLEVLEHPPVREPASPRGWFRTVLKFTAIDAFRRARARRVHERAAARPERLDASPAELVARAETLDRVAHAVLELDEPYRATVLLRYFEGLEARAIAEFQGIPVETVRTRLKRAVAQLRERLDAENKGDRRRWCLALLPLFRRPSSGTAAVAGSASTAAAGALLMGMKTKTAVVAAAVILMIGTSLMLLRSRDSTTGGPYRIERHGIPIGFARSPSAEGTSGEKAVGRDTVSEMPPPAVEYPGSVIVRVVDSTDHRPVDRARVEVQDMASIWTGSTDASGACRFPGVESGLVEIRVVAEGFFAGGGTVTLAQGANPDVEYSLDRAALLEGKVLAVVDGRPIAGATVKGIALDVPGPGQLRRASTTTTAEGTWRLRYGMAGHAMALEARAPGFSPSKVLRVLPATGVSSFRIDFPLERAGEIRGVVLDPGGKPASGAFVSASWARFPPSAADSKELRQSDGTPVRPFITRTAADGTFLLDEVEAGGLYEVWAYSLQLPGKGTNSSEPIEVFLPQEAPAARLEIRLRHEGSLLIRWTGEAGSPPPAGMAWLHGTRSRRDFASSDLAWGWEQVGRLLPDLYTLTVRAGGLVGTAEKELAEGEEAEVEVPLSMGPSIQGVVVRPDGSPVASATVCAIPPGQAAPGLRFGFPDPGARRGGMYFSRPPSARPLSRLYAGVGPILGYTRSNAEGRFSIGGPAAGEEVMLLAEAGLGTDVAGPRLPSSPPMRMVLPPAGKVVGRLVPPAGVAPPPRAWIRATREPDGTRGDAVPWSWQWEMPFKDGAFSMPVPSGPGRIAVLAGDGESSGWTYVAPRRYDLEPGGTIDLGDLPMQAGVTVAGRVTDTTGRGVEGAIATAGNLATAASDEQGRFLLTGLPPGTMEISVSHMDYLPAHVETGPEVGTAPLAVSLLKGGLLSGTVLDARGRPFSGGRATVFEPGTSNPVASARTDHRGRFRLRLAPGQVQIEIRGPQREEDVLSTATAVLTEGGDAALTIQLK